MGYHLIIAGIQAYCVVPRRTNTDLRSRLFPDAVWRVCGVDGNDKVQDPTDALDAGHVADVVVSVALDTSPLLSGQLFWAK